MFRGFDNIVRSIALDIRKTKLKIIMDYKMTRGEIIRFIGSACVGENAGSFRCMPVVLGKLA